jgi:hypothetical protein
VVFDPGRGALPLEDVEQVRRRGITEHNFGGEGFGNRSLLRLDRQGWERVTAAVEDLHRLALVEQERARARMRKSGEKPVPTTVMLAAFESPKTGAKEP